MSVSVSSFSWNVYGLNVSPRGHDVELLLVAPGQGGAVTGGVARLRAPGAGRGLQTLAARLLGHAGVLTQQPQPPRAPGVTQRVLATCHVRQQRGHY